MSFVRTIHRASPLFYPNEYTPQSLRDRMSLRKQAMSRELLAARPIVVDSRYSTLTTSASLGFNPYWSVNGSQSFSYDADHVNSLRRRTNVSVILFRHLGDVTSVSTSNAYKHPLSGLNTGATSSDHQMNLFFGAWPRELENASPHTYTRSGGTANFLLMTLLLENIAMHGQIGTNYVTSAATAPAPSLTFPEFQPRRGNSLLLYLATTQLASTSTPYFLTWNAPQLTRAGGTSTSYTNGYQTGASSVGYGTEVIMPYRITSGQPDLIAPVTCNLSSISSALMAIVEIEAGLDYIRV